MFLEYGGQRHFWQKTHLRRAAACLPAAGLIAIAGCASGGGSSAASPPSPPASPKQAILAAAIQAQKITSAAETIDVRFSGVESGRETATAKFRLKPSLEISEDLSQATVGKTTPIKVILTRTALYLSDPSQASQAGKPWIKIGISQLKGTPAASFAQLWQELQNNNFADQDQLLAVAKDARVVGNQTIGGVPTTEYAGSVTVAEALKALPAAFRKALSPELQTMGGGTVIHFRIWLDDQNQTRKLAEVETFGGRTVSTTTTVTAINGPVDIVLPPASQTLTIPKL